MNIRYTVVCCLVVGIGLMIITNSWAYVILNTPIPTCLGHLQEHYLFCYGLGSENLELHREKARYSADPKQHVLEPRINFIDDFPNKVQLKNDLIKYYKIHLMPKSEKDTQEIAQRIYDRIARAVVEKRPIIDDVRFARAIENFKVNRWEELGVERLPERQDEYQLMPFIVIYPVTDKGEVEYLINELAKMFKDYKGISHDDFTNVPMVFIEQGYSGRPLTNEQKQRITLIPRYNKPFGNSNLIFYAQGDSDHKKSMTDCKSDSETIRTTYAACYYSAPDNWAVYKDNFIPGIPAGAYYLLPASVTPVLPEVQKRVELIAPLVDLGKTLQALTAEINTVKLQVLDRERLDSLLKRAREVHKTATDILNKKEYRAQYNWSSQQLVINENKAREIKETVNGLISKISAEIRER